MKMLLKISNTHTRVNAHTHKDARNDGVEEAQDAISALPLFPADAALGDELSTVGVGVDFIRHHQLEEGLVKIASALHDCPAKHSERI